MAAETAITRSGGRAPLLRRVLSLVAIVAGASILTFAGMYTYWRMRSGSDSGRFNVETTDDQIGIVRPDRQASGPVSAYASLYPGGSVNPRYWDNPDWAGPEPFGAPGIPAGFTPVSSRDPVAALAAGNPATRIRIPVIGLDSYVSELQLLDLGDQSSYETPKNTVGHIPETAAPGELNTGWFFGHLESFGTGEGSVFNRLPEIADRLKNDPVDIFIETDDADYMYRVTSTSQVRQEDLALERSDNAQITLCTCWPPRVYDQRVLVHAELIAVRRG
jgi:sortase (surface protein transpeptidase)